MNKLYCNFSLYVYIQAVNSSSFQLPDQQKKALHKNNICIMNIIHNKSLNVISSTRIAEDAQRLQNNTYNTCYCKKAKQHNKIQKKIMLNINASISVR